MPEVEYIKDYKRESGRTVPKGSRGHVSRQKAAELEKAGYITVVGSESNRATQERTSKINAASQSKSKKDKE